MLWFYSICVSNYNEETIAKLAKDYSLNKIIKAPGIEDIREHMGNTKIGFIAPYYPDKLFSQIFVVIELGNKHGILTEQEYMVSMTHEQAVEKRLGLEAKIPKINLSNIGGAEKLKKWAKEVEVLLAQGENIKGAFFVGITGSGKTMFVEAFAGEMQRTMVSLNLPALMESENPIQRLHGVFKYLEKETKNGGRFVLLMDEVEKMLNVKNGSQIQEQFLGQLLTILNNLNNPASSNGIKADVLVFATANNLSVIMDNNPEFIRPERWDEKFFINYPKEADAINIYKLYASKYGVEELLDDDFVHSCYVIANTFYQSVNTQTELSVYVPAEIHEVVKRLGRYKRVYNHVSHEAFKDIIKLIIPIQQTAAKGIKAQINDSAYGFVKV